MFFLFRSPLAKPTKRRGTLPPSGASSAAAATAEARRLGSREGRDKRSWTSWATLGRPATLGNTAVCSSSQQSDRTRTPLACQGLAEEEGSAKAWSGNVPPLETALAKTLQSDRQMVGSARTQREDDWHLHCMRVPSLAFAVYDGRS